MIEVEKKVSLTDSKIASLLSGAKLIREFNIVDTYFDYSDFRLVKKLWWLRLRENNWELKIDVGKDRLNQVASMFNEITDPIKIAKKLKIPDL